MAVRLLHSQQRTQMNKCRQLGGPGGASVSILVSASWRVTEAFAKLELHQSRPYSVQSPPEGIDRHGTHHERFGGELSCGSRLILGQSAKCRLEHAGKNTSDPAKVTGTQVLFGFGQKKGNPDWQARHPRAKDPASPFHSCSRRRWARLKPTPHQAWRGECLPGSLAEWVTGFAAS